MRAKAQPKDAESTFGIEELFFSTTDAKGVIIAGNQVFVRVSKFSENELLGKPHNIIRHPDMPKAVFRLLWDTIGKGNPIGAYVKNMAADGCYYWVFAVVIPIGNEYLSIRLKPSSEIFKLIPKVYAEMLKVESKSGMDGATTYLVNTLQSLGISSYAQFMSRALKAEISSRRNQIKDRLDPSVTTKPAPPENQKLQKDLLHLLKTTRSLKSEFFQLFDLVSQMDETRGSIVEDASVIKEFVRKVKFLAFNASTSAQRLGAAGRTLAVVAQQMQVNSAESAKSAQNFGNSMAKSLEAQEAITFEVAAALLETETLELFICEALECLHNITTCNRSQLNYKIKVLGQALDRGVKTSAKHSRLVNDAVAQFKVSNENLHEMISQAGLVHVTAKVETSAISDPSNLHVIFSDLRASVDSAEKAISRLIGATTKTATDLYEMLDAEARVEDLARSAKDTIANIDQS